MLILELILGELNTVNVELDVLIDQYSKNIDVFQEPLIKYKGSVHPFIREDKNLDVKFILSPRKLWPRLEGEKIAYIMESSHKQVHKGYAEILTKINTSQMIENEIKEHNPDFSSSEVLSRIKKFEQAKQKINNSCLLPKNSIVLETRLSASTVNSSNTL